MKCTLRLVSLALFAAVQLFSSLARAEPALTVEEHRLRNGLRVLLAPDDAIDDVSVAVGYAAGTADEPDGDDGLAHLVEHLMFRGSSHVAPGEHSQQLQTAGAWDVNARTSLDDTVFYETLPPGALPITLWLESDRMASQLAAVDEATVAQERAVIANEVRDRRVDPLLASFTSAVRDDVFPAGHPYHSHDDEQIDAAIADLKLRDAQAFARTWYTPANATVAIAGRFDPRVALDLAARYFGPLPSAPPPQRPALPASRLGMRSVYAAGITRGIVLFSWLTPPPATPGDLDLDVLAQVLTGRGGRLKRALVETGLAARVVSREVSFARASVFSIQVVVAENVSPDAVAAALDQEIDAVRRDLTPSEVDLAKRRIRDRELAQLESSGARAILLAAHPGAGGLETRNHDACDAKSVVATARAWLTPQNGVSALVRPAANAPARGMTVWRERVSP